MVRRALRRRARTRIGGRAPERKRTSRPIRAADLHARAARPAPPAPTGCSSCASPPSVRAATSSTSRSSRWPCTRSGSTTGVGGGRVPRLRRVTTSGGTATGRSRRAAGHAGFQAARFLPVCVVAFLFGCALLVLLVDVAGLPKVPAQAMAVVRRRRDFLGRSSGASQVIGRGALRALCLGALLAPAASAQTAGCSRPRRPPRPNRTRSARRRRCRPPITAPHRDKAIAIAEAPKVIDTKRHHRHLPGAYLKGRTAGRSSSLTRRRGKEIAQVMINDRTGRSPRRGPASRSLDDGARLRGRVRAQSTRSGCGSRCACCSSSPSSTVAAVPRCCTSTCCAARLLGLARFFDHAGSASRSRWSTRCSPTCWCACWVASGAPGPRRAAAPARARHWLVVAIVFLIGFRVGLNVTNSNVSTSATRA